MFGLSVLRLASTSSKVIFVHALSLLSWLADVNHQKVDIQQPLGFGVGGREDETSGELRAVTGATVRLSVEGQ